MQSASFIAENHFHPKFKSSKIIFCFSSVVHMVVESKELSLICCILPEYCDSKKG